MKLKLNYIAAALAVATLFVSCNNDDNGSPVMPGTNGDAELFFDNGIAENEFSLGTVFTNSNGENLTYSRLNYIISNIVFIKEDGDEYVYPKEDSYFIISQETGEFTIHLHDIPAGDYKKVRFGIGVDPERYQEGQAGQEDFWDYALANNMAGTWDEGYRFINMEGTFTSGANAEQKFFSIYLMNGAEANNYKEVTLNLPTTARVRENESPSIHIMTDVNVLLDGNYKIKLTDYLNEEGASTVINSGAVLHDFAVNAQQMFVVDHVHNGSGHHD